MIPPEENVGCAGSDLARAGRLVASQARTVQAASQTIGQENYDQGTVPSRTLAAETSLALL
ncbi:hypothetical protein KTAU_24050 [Thermogemmatispora aurantia]|uniref:Uncharacterized protein n=1 Tax=Thermogemmatispora aurantia TaxID=2045279 RepID=A0A5J4K517_9CHLR|nr:hypothetical protein [Thermogemmatispora aurantia]GER83768.1 hypothetical protein KTAU_24050 [Thermogemmatispora aurantia]